MESSKAYVGHYVGLLRENKMNLFYRTFSILNLCRVNRSPAVSGFTVQDRKWFTGRITLHLMPCITYIRTYLLPSFFSPIIFILLHPDILIPRKKKASWYLTTPMSTFVEESTGAPLSNSSSTKSLCPSFAARWSAFRPFCREINRHIFK